MRSAGQAPGPLDGVRVLELGGIGVAPFAGMVLADLGASVTRVDRPGGESMAPTGGPHDFINRGKRSVVLDLKRQESTDIALRLAACSHILIEGWRPGVAERLGVGPVPCHDRNPSLVYGRVTGWGQDGPYAQIVGHDINYLAIVGALNAIGPREGPPQIPLNLVGDIGGGAMFLVAGVLAGLHESRATGVGRVVDASIADGVASMLASTLSMRAAGSWSDQRETNVADGGAPFYRTYETADGRFMAVGALEPAFYQELIAVLGVQVEARAQYHRETWPEVRALFTARFAARTQRDWIEQFAGSKACVTPVLSFTESVCDPHVRHRRALMQDGTSPLTPGIAPRFAGSSIQPALPPSRLGQDTDAVLNELGLRRP